MFNVCRLEMYFSLIPKWQMTGKLKKIIKNQTKVNLNVDFTHSRLYKYGSHLLIIIDHTKKKHFKKLYGNMF